MDTQFLNIEYIFFVIYQLINGGRDFTRPLEENPQTFFLTGFYDLLSNVWIIFTLVMTVLCLILAAILIYSLLRLKQIRAEEEVYYASSVAVAEDAAEYTNKRWENIEHLTASPNETDWRQAIIEADILLEELLTAQGYDGAGVGEKLKQVEPSDFTTLQKAWDAHKVRNRIAHDGSAFILTRRDAQQTLRWYEEVFREFFFI